MKKYQKTMIFTSFMMIMIGLGASDALRGVFAPIFQSHFRLNTVQLSMIITISYVGNLLFLSLGGMVVDRYKRKNVAIGVMVLWMGALVPIWQRIIISACWSACCLPWGRPL